MHPEHIKPLQGWPIASPRPDPNPHSITPDGRIRSCTLDSFNISSIESSKPHHRAVDPHNQEDHHVETATWLFSDILQSFSGRDNDVRQVITKSNQLVALLKENPLLKQDIVIEHVVNRIQFMFYHPSSQLRCAAYRILRHSCANQESVLYVVRLKVLISVIVTLSTPSTLVEKEEALKLIREFLALPSGADFISVGVIKALVALVELRYEEQSDQDSAALLQVPQSFTRICIETICEMAVLKPEIVFHGGGLRLMIYTIIKGSSDIGTSCLVVLLSLLDRADARLYLRNGFDLDSLISVYSQFEDDDEQKHASAKKDYKRALKISFLLTLFLKCWTGFICFSHNKFDALKTLLSNLRKKNNRLRSMIMDILLDVLRIKALPWLEESSIGEIISKFYSFVNGGSKVADMLQFEYLQLNPLSFECTVVSHYQGLLLKVLFNCGIVPLIFDIINEDRDKDTTMKATFLLTNIFSLSVKLLPQELFSAPIFEAYRQSMSLASITKIEAATRLQMKRGGDFKKRTEVRNYVKEMVTISRSEMDDNEFKTMITNTRVLSVKEFEEWNWTHISHLFQGPMRNHKRFLEIQEKYPKFLKSVMSFFRPFKYRFSNIPIQRNSKYPKLNNPKRIIMIGCQLIESLLTFEAGFRYLATSKLMPQLAEIFAQVDRYSGITAKEPILSKRRLENTLSIGYIKFIYTLSSNALGLKILEQWQFYHILNNIIEASADDELNNHLIFNLLNNLDYTHKSPLRLLLTRCLSISNWKIKAFTLENVIPRLLLSEECETLAIENLVNLLHDENDAIVKMSVDYLHDFYIIRNNHLRIDVLIGFKPPIRVLSESQEGKLLLLNFCKTTKGYRFLFENGFIEHYFQESVRSLQGFEYLTAIEATLTIHYFPFIKVPQDLESLYSADLHHFFHYLLATEDGFTFFSHHRHHIDEYISKINAISKMLNLMETVQGGEDSQDELKRETSESALVEYDITRSDDLEDLGDNPFEDTSFLQPMGITGNFARDEDQRAHDTMALNFKTAEIKEEYLLKRLKQYIWVIGEIASANYGIQILDPIYGSDMRSEHIVETLYQLFQKSANWQIRGLAFYQLGKVASTVEGVEMLDDLHWVSLDSYETQNGLKLAYPKSIIEEDIFNIEILNPYQDASYFSLFGETDGGDYASEQFGLEDEIEINSYEKLDERILALIKNLAATAHPKTMKMATKELTKIKSENAEAFENVNLFLKTVRLVDKGKFRYRTRSFIFNLFDTSLVMENLVKKDRKNSTIKK